jgi:hypothetical protein
MSIPRAIFLAILLAAATAGFYVAFTRKPPPPPALQPIPNVFSGTGIAPFGGELFLEKVLIEVPLYRQGDARWKREPLAWGQDGNTIGSHGCAVTSAAMVLHSYGVWTTPPELNQFLIKNKGYTAEGWLMWEKAAELNPEHVKFVYEGPPKYALIDANLRRNNPVIVRLRYPNAADGTPGITHFVVICGKQGHDYLIRDPGRGADKGVYALREFGSNIEALRYYEKIGGILIPTSF